MTRTIRILQKTGTPFTDAQLLDLALTHASKNKTVNNQRLEFLGDRVLGLVLADMLYTAYPDEAEGALALRHAHLARAGTLAQIARHYDLSDDIIVSSPERAGGTVEIDNVLADALEALIGALYLDQGYETCRIFVQALWADSVRELAAPPQDPKNTLQEWAQGRGLPLPVYTLIDRSGPDHAPIFTVEVAVKPDLWAKGRGTSRKIAEKQAAQALLEDLKVMDDKDHEK